MPDPRIRLTLPVPQSIIDAHRAMLETNGPHAMKDVALDMEEPDFLFDVLAIEAAIADRSLPVTTGVWPTDYARRVWHMDFDGAVVSQGEGSNVDLVWAATMPAFRAAAPVLVISYAEGLSLFDGAHRLTRALIEGAVDHPSLIFRRTDALAYRRPRTD